MTGPSLAPDLARIPAGEFLMGAADANEDERPVHRVPFALSQVCGVPERR